MRQRFFRQNWFWHKRLEKKWRRPKGKQSKMRLGKKGKPPRAKVGYKGGDRLEIPVVNNADELKSLSVEKIILASGLGARKAEEVAREAEKLGIAILNKRKVERAGKISRAITKAREEKAKAEKEKKKEGKAKEEKAEAKGKDKEGKMKEERGKDEEVKAREETGGERKAAGEPKHEAKGKAKGV